MKHGHCLKLVLTIYFPCCYNSIVGHLKFLFQFTIPFIASVRLTLPSPMLKLTLIVALRWPGSAFICLFATQLQKFFIAIFWSAVIIGRFKHHPAKSFVALPSFVCSFWTSLLSSFVTVSRALRPDSVVLVHHLCFHFMKYFAASAPTTFLSCADTSRIFFYVTFWK